MSSERSTSRGCQFTALVTLGALMVAVPALLLNVSKPSALASAVLAAVGLVPLLASLAASLWAVAKKLPRAGPSTMIQWVAALLGVAFVSNAVAFVLYADAAGSRSDIASPLFLSADVVSGIGVLIVLMRGRRPRDSMAVAVALVCFGCGVALGVHGLLVVVLLRNVGVGICLCALSALAHLVALGALCTMLAPRARAVTSSVWQETRKQLGAVCPACGEVVRRDARACRNCRHVFTEEERRAMLYARKKKKCPMCLEKVPALSTECEHCGHHFEEGPLPVGEPGTGGTTGKPLVPDEDEAELSDADKKRFAKIEKSGRVAGMALVKGEKIVDRAGQSILETQSLLRWNTAYLTTKRVIIAFKTLFTSSNVHAVELDKVQAMSVHREEPWYAVIFLVFHAIIFVVVPSLLWEEDGLVGSLI